MDEMQARPIHLQPTMPNSILPGAAKGKPTDKGTPFLETLKNSIEEINKLQQNANMQVEKLARGEVKDVHQVMIAAQEASLSFSLMMQIRNKIVDTYEKIVQM